ncbi:alpha/beta hydrolase [Chryseobacterium sp. BIGb0232]|uniref:alpha/beta hydrolase n=1 Tax=Chryseobacterium sp. BIGb0232 TaxID=2940598 RepID=UPI000F47B23F|nr:alpha/beta hydrolase [Chryseobacterium sp. BIGb0232]MCS4304094.1 acetyl esterase/lipase [Chryseobacterium sp. BIGb0232]ROS17674.1 acetyl esterase/lipase [Chryseobacterium nakagawai]
MKYQLKLADELIPILKEYTNQPVPPEGTPLQEVFRGALQQMAKQIGVNSTDELKVENKFFTNSDGLQTQLRVFTPLVTNDIKPLIYWIHGGGTMSGLPEQEDPVLFRLALELNAVIVSVNYRLAPENPYPKPLNDCYEGLVHVVNNATEFGIDTEKVIVSGGSAGGLFTTSVAIKARNENGPKILLQVMAYPMLDHTDTSDSNKEITDIGVWDSAMNHYGFQCYLTGVAASEYRNAVPLLVEDLTNLPDAFIAVGTMDCLRDEGIAYAQKLAASGVQTELHIYPGVVHVFDGIAPDLKASKDFWKARIDAINRALNK